MITIVQIAIIMDYHLINSKMQDKVNSKLERWENDLRRIQHGYKTKVKPVLENAIGKPITHATIDVLQQTIDLFLYDIDIKVNVINRK